MQLQRHLTELEREGLRVFAVSYDTVAELKDFAGRYGITYDLLSDADSATIRRFGILNTLIEPDHPIKTAAGRSYYGIPFPGVYVVGPSGLVVEKFFNRSYSTRTSSGTVLNSALGEIIKPEAGPSESAGGKRLGFTAFLADPALRLEYASTLYVRFNVADGYHIYADPLPEGFIATTVTIEDANGLTVGEPKYPPTRMQRFEDLGVTLPVYEGDVDVAVPVTANAAVLNWMLRL